MSLIVALGYWILMSIDEKLIWGKRDPHAIDVNYALYYLHGINHI